MFLHVCLGGQMLASNASEQGLHHATEALACRKEHSEKKQRRAQKFHQKRQAHNGNPRILQRHGGNLQIGF
jgi:hypothetical protein